MGLGTALKYLALTYVVLCVLVLFNMTRPVSCNSKTQRCLEPAFSSESRFDLLVYVSEFPDLGDKPHFPTAINQCNSVPDSSSKSCTDIHSAAGEDLQLLWEQRDVSCSFADTLHTVVNVSDAYKSFRNNGSLYAHAFLTEPNTPPSLRGTKQSYVVAPLTQHMPSLSQNRSMLIADLSSEAPTTSTTHQVVQMLAATVGSILILSASYFLHHPRYGGWSYVVLASVTSAVFVYTILLRLNQGQFIFSGGGGSSGSGGHGSGATLGTIFAKAAPAVTHWKGALQLDVVTELTSIGVSDPSNADVSALVKAYGNVQLNSNQYSPLFSNEDFSLVRRYFTRVTPNSSSTLEIVLRPRSLFMFRGLHLMEHQLKENVRLGLFTEHDLDDLRLFFSRQKLWVLVLTYVVSLLHMLFSFLAFKNDVGFYRSKRDFTGLSSRTVISSFMCSLIVYLYLVDNELTSGLILLSTGVGCLIELWKIKRILKVEVTSEWPFVVNSPASNAEQTTERFDMMATTYLGMTLYPIVLGLALWSLVYHPQRSWWSWAIGNLAYGVYVFGFIMMTPQLFINYQLKSVAHMPWKVLMYKAFNTFIDDVFSFVVAMPTAHRIACLRDDLVFFVYLYQRWCFPVDKSRPNEYGMVYEPPEQQTATSGQQKDSSASTAAAHEPTTGGDANDTGLRKRG